MRKDSKADFVSLDVTGVKELKLVSDEAGNGGLGDFASWADTKVYSINSRPKLTIPASQIIKVGETLNLTEGVYAIDAEDGDITSNVVLSGDVNFNKVGRYNVTYTITDNDGNTVEKARTISVVNMEDYTYLSDIKWKSANSGWRTIQKDKSIEENPIRLTDENGNEVEYEKALYGDDIMIVPFDRLPVLTTNGVWEIMWCVSSSTEYPEESVKAIDLIYSDEELTDLLLYGVEQKDYVALDNGSIDFPDPYSLENAPYFNKTKWIFNRYLSKRWNGVSENINEKMRRFNESAVISPAYGFRLDYSKITVDLMPIRDLIEEYERKLGCGVLDVDTALPEFQRKLRENGSEELIAQVQDQLNQWKKQTEN